MKTPAFLMVLALLGTVSSVPPGHARLGGREVDNGGDSLVYNFREKGRRIITFLKTTSTGLRLANSHGLSIDRLEATLAPGNITTVLERPSNPLPNFDKTRLQEPVSPIVLVRLEWADARARPVFHTMLEAAGYDDPDSEISDSLPESHLTD